MREIPLTKGKIALVSDEDYERVAAFRWCASNESRGTKWYAIRWTRNAEGKQVKVRMHRFIMADALALAESGAVVDHLNHDPLDNRRENLEVISQEENMRRSPGWRKKPEDIFL